MSEKGCNNCVHQPEPLTTCDWLKEQKQIILDCTRFERKKLNGMSDIDIMNYYPITEMVNDISNKIREKEDEYIIQKCINVNVDPDAIIKQQFIINELRTKINNDGWIPCSERLPKDRKEVLVTAYWHETYQVMIASYYGDCLWWCVPFNNCGEHMQKLKPIAWKPLPEPYKESDV